MAYNINTLTNLNGSFKQVHLPKLENLVGEDHILIKDIPFQNGIKLGQQFRQPVYLTRPHGITFAPSDSAPTLAAPISPQTKELTFDAYQIIMRDRISYDAADRMAKGGGEEGDNQAYISETGDLPEWLRLSHLHYVEMMLWNGQSATGIGVVDANGISGNQLTITTDSWAPQNWVGSEGMKLDVYRSTTFQKTVSVTAYNLDFATATVAGTVTVDSSAGMAAGDILHVSGSYNNTIRGIDDIITETTNQFGQSPSEFNLLRGVERDCGSAALKFKMLMYGLAQARAKGLSKKAKLYVSEFTFPDLVDEVEAARTDPQRAAAAGMRGTKIERGADSMTVFSPNGTFEIQVSSYCKMGAAYGLIRDGSWRRLGTSDVTFQVPGSKGDFYMHLENVAGYELRSWANFANYTPRAGSNVKFKNIKNSIVGGL